MSGEQPGNAAATVGAQGDATPVSPRDEALRARVRDALAASDPSQVPSFDRLWTAAAAGPPSSRRRASLLTPRFAAVAAGVMVVVVALVALEARRGADRETGRATAADVSTDVGEHADGAGRAAPNAATATDDYRLAARVAAEFARPSPLDRLTASLPPSMSRGLPAISEYRYPLLPEEIPL
jgi:hypothetical protein